MRTTWLNLDGWGHFVTDGSDGNDGSDGYTGRANTVGEGEQTELRAAPVVAGDGATTGAAMCRGRLVCPYDTLPALRRKQPRASNPPPRRIKLPGSGTLAG